MKIVKSYAIMRNDCMADYCLEDGLIALRKCEYCGRVSHRSEDKITEDSYDKFIRSIVIDHGDFSIIEHASVTVEALVDRGITHEWVRHRLGAYTQESTRFVNYDKKNSFNFISPLEENMDGFVAFCNNCHTSEQYYLSILRSNKSPQIARSVLPNALASKIIVTYNLRMWRHFFIMRTSKETHPQFKEVTIPLLKEFQEKIPILYEDIIPEERQINNMKKPH